MKNITIRIVVQFSIIFLTIITFSCSKTVLLNPNTKEKPEYIDSLSSGHLYKLLIDTNTNSPNIYIDGIKRDNIHNIFLSEGNHEIEIIKDGYPSLKKTIAVDKDNTNFNFSLVNLNIDMLDLLQRKYPNHILGIGKASTENMAKSDAKDNFVKNFNKSALMTLNNKSNTQAESQSVGIINNYSLAKYRDVDVLEKGVDENGNFYCVFGVEIDHEISVQNNIQKEKLNKIQRHSQVSFPNVIRLNKWYNLRIQIIMTEKISDSGEVIKVDKPSEEDITISITPSKTEPDEPIELDVKVTASNFEIKQDSHHKLSIPIHSDSAPVFWQLKPLETGEQIILLDFFQKAKYLGTVKLQSLVSDDDSIMSEKELASTTQKKFTLCNYLSPDLTIFVRPEAVDNTSSKYEFLLFSPPEKLDMSFYKCGETLLSTSPKDWTAAQMKELETLLPYTSKSNNLAVQNHLESMGRTIFIDLFPPELQDILRSSDQIESINIISPEPYIPWETAFFSRNEEDEKFLCEQFDVTRWLQGRTSPQEILVNEAAIITLAETQSMPGLINTTRESEMISQIFSSTLINKINPLLGEVDNLFRKGESGLFHFACHSDYDLGGDLSKIYLEDGEFAANWLSNPLYDLSSKTPFVFLNACQSGRMGFTLSGMGGWVQEFLNAGAGAFVGPLWIVEDEAAYDFAFKLYIYLNEGKTLGESARLARNNLKDNDPYYSWLAYTVYGDPNTKLKIKK